MKLPVTETRSFEIAPAGNHLAICYMLIDLGTQKSDYNGQEKLQRKIIIGWELPNEPMTDGRPFVVSKWYTFSMYGLADLRKHLESWRGRKFVDSDFGPDGFDLKNILGHACQLNVIHETKESTGKTRDRVDSVSPLVKGTKVPEAQNKIVYFSFDEPTDAEFDALSDRIQEKIKASPEYAAWRKSQTRTVEEVQPQRQDVGDAIPF